MLFCEGIHYRSHLLFYFLVTQEVHSLFPQSPFKFHYSFENPSSLKPFHKQDNLYFDKLLSIIDESNDHISMKHNI